MLQASTISDQSSMVEACDALPYNETSNDLHLMVKKWKMLQAINGAGSSGQDLKWDYTALPLLGGNAPGSKEDELSHPNIATLDAIYQSIMARQEETRPDSRRLAASRKLQRGDPQIGQNVL
ncbi:hypothetical protein NDU88_005863 [Pleurodeles waltl]|uniref:Uncharacterized protein n=1 Tax=Pleurodeles waltl TaxID=8319 RepID=A0AAV7W903_PLEWA|nr:hypothetical protein NDU88_005863 [Pleurodeles waltl]